MGAWRGWLWPLDSRGRGSVCGGARLKGRGWAPPVLALPLWGSPHLRRRTFEPKARRCAPSEKRAFDVPRRRPPLRFPPATRGRVTRARRTTIAVSAGANVQRFGGIGDLQAKDQGSQRHQLPPKGTNTSLRGSTYLVRLVARRLLPSDESIALCVREAVHFDAVAALPTERSPFIPRPERGGLAGAPSASHARPSPLQAPHPTRVFFLTRGPRYCSPFGESNPVVRPVTPARQAHVFTLVSSDEVWMSVWILLSIGM